MNLTEEFILQISSKFQQSTPTNRGARSRWNIASTKERGVFQGYVLISGRRKVWQRIKCLRSTIIYDKLPREHGGKVMTSSICTVSSPVTITVRSVFYYHLGMLLHHGSACSKHGFWGKSVVSFVVMCFIVVSVRFPDVWWGGWKSSPCGHAHPVTFSS